ncbi:MAG: FG-GAP repeat protein, partial [Phycisphaerales bacterium]|nr:FG-GAP repeat protein [Phycisphaerales bacterium]
SDLLIGTWLSDGPRTNQGLRVFYGRAERFPATSLSAADATFVSPGDAARPRIFPRAAAIAGDLDGDGYLDLLMSTNDDDPVGDIAEVFVVYGSGSRFAGTITLDDASVPHIWTDVRSSLGIALSSAGDVNGDGFADMLIGDPGYNAGNRAHVIYGGAERIEGAYDIELAPFRMLGAMGTDNLGVGVTGGGDIDSDGFADILIGAPGQSRDGTYGGVVHLIHGGADRPLGTWPSSDSDATFEGTVLVDENDQNETAGYQLSVGGDVNGDGYDDILISASDNHIGDEFGGRVYLFYGGPALWSEDVDVTDPVTEDPALDDAWPGAVEAEAGANVRTGRIVVCPDPVALPYMDIGHAEVEVQLLNTGSEPIEVVSVRVEGAPSVQVHPSALDRFPDEIRGDADANGYSGIGFTVQAASWFDPAETGELVIVTADSTSPTLRIPLGFVPYDADLVEGDGESCAPFLYAKPNPIRVRRAGGTQTVTLDLRSGGWGETVP